MKKNQSLFLFLIISLSFVQFGCGKTELQHGLNEEQANEVLVVLQQSGVDASKVKEEGEQPTWAIAVPKEDGPKSWRIMKQHDLPRATEKGLAETFGKDSLIPTAMEEKALYLQAICNELQKTIEAIDGIVKARVHIVLPQEQLLPEEATPENRPKAVVLVKYRKSSSGQVPYRDEAIKALVANSIHKLDPKDVAVVGTEITSTFVQRAGGTTSSGSQPPSFVWIGPLKIAQDSVGVFKVSAVSILAFIALLAIGLIFTAKKSSDYKSELNRLRESRSELAKLQVG